MKRKVLWLIVVAIVAEISIGVAWGVTGTIPRPPRGYAVVVGIDNYPGLDPLQGCVADANATRGFLEQMGFDPSNIVYLTDDLATKANITAAIARTAASMEPGDTFVLYFSGHGHIACAPGTQGACSVHTSHPYWNGFVNETFNVTAPGAIAMRVQFSNFDVEPDYALVAVCDTNGVPAGEYDGNQGTFWSAWVPGNTTCIEFLANGNPYGHHGFDVTSYEVATQMNATLVPYDYAAAEVQGWELAAALAAVPGSNQVCVFDTCMSGGFMPLLAQAGRCVVAASSFPGYSLVDPVTNRGMFTESWLGALANETTSNGTALLDPAFAASASWVENWSRQYGII
jgi:hypothetical protein